MSNTLSEEQDDLTVQGLQHSQQQPAGSETDVATVNDNGHEQNPPFTLRALVSTKEAGVIIGKAGKNVAELRESTGVKAGVSKVVQGVHDRVLTVSGTLEGVAKAYSLIAFTMSEIPSSTFIQQELATIIKSTATSDNDDKDDTTAVNVTTTIRLLISHNLMGTVIGRQGAKIKHIQDMTGVRMTASKALLPQSTERVVEVRGAVNGIEQAILEIGHCLIEDKDRAYGTILYNPAKVTTMEAAAAAAVEQHQHPYNGNNNSNRQHATLVRTGNGSDFSSSNSNTMGGHHHHNSRHHQYRPQQHRQPFSSQSNPDAENIRTQEISIPSDMVGCIIGKGGTKISEIRILSGSHISIAKVPHDESGERMFTIQGSPESNERALYLLYGQLENEKERRLRGVAKQQNDVFLEE